MSEIERKKNSKTNKLFQKKDWKKRRADILYYFARVSSHTIPHYHTPASAVLFRACDQISLRPQPGDLWTTDKISYSKPLINVERTLCRNVTSTPPALTSCARLFGAFLWCHWSSWAVQGSLMLSAGVYTPNPLRKFTPCPSWGNMACSV